MRRAPAAPRGNVTLVTAAADARDRSPVSAPRVLTRAEGSLGRITLNRPEALNALDIGMIRALRDALDAWRDDTDVQLVYIDGAGERGLCAGGDVRALYDYVRAGQAEDAAQFFREEYALNAAIAEYPKPIVTIADGITMGGGIGVAGHATIRIVTERSKLAMPETRIGFTPDVGGTRLLAQAPGRLGEYFAMTGRTMTASDALYMGFADYYVPSENLEALREALAFRADPAGPAEIVLLFDETPDASPLAQARAEWIDEAFAAGSPAEIVERLRESTADDASAAVDLLGELSPTGVAVTLDAVREARELPTLRDALEGEYRRVMWFVQQHPDLVEGIRAQLVDKDRDPKWQPATIAELAADAGAGARSFVPALPLWD
ncbi:3-hydroxyisobutyryl-CoA hydrolase [Microbacterium keratanolyticum]|uniref:3-hydroxyisobutyryl-CoA hydrolase n=1 Tax=Microbacterium keratanolyticum TaxID=67574 RepID=A0A9W6M8M5_9MICO|nr:3-hydroxyisobutyryl-CoA hydrolase [Microbacterium keratanolyticum]